MKSSGLATNVLLAAVLLFAFGLPAYGESHGQTVNLTVEGMT